MAHLAARARLGFAVEMQLHIRIAQCRGPIRLAIFPEVSEQIGHRSGTTKFGGTKRQAADRAHLLLELAGGAGVDGEMAGVVRARREFIHE